VYIKDDSEELLPHQAWTTISQASGAAIYNRDIPSITGMGEVLEGEYA
jgi:hypothetical protein